MLAKGPAMLEVENAAAVNREGNTIAPVEKANTTHVPSPRQQTNMQIKIFEALSGAEISIILRRIVKIITNDRAPIHAVLREILLRNMGAKKFDMSHAATFTSRLK